MLVWGIIVAAEERALLTGIPNLKSGKKKGWKRGGNDQSIK